MAILRFFGIFSFLLIVCSIALGFFTGEKKFLFFSWHLFRYSIFVAVIVFAFLILERAAIIIL